MYILDKDFIIDKEALEGGNFKPWTVDNICGLISTNADNDFLDVVVFIKDGKIREQLIINSSESNGKWLREAIESQIYKNKFTFATVYAELNAQAEKIIDKEVLDKVNEDIYVFNMKTDWDKAHYVSDMEKFRNACAIDDTQTYFDNINGHGEGAFRTSSDYMDKNE